MSQWIYSKNNFIFRNLRLQGLYDICDLKRTKFLKIVEKKNNIRVIKPSAITKI